MKWSLYKYLWCRYVYLCRIELATSPEACQWLQGIAEGQRTTVEGTARATPIDTMRNKMADSFSLFKVFNNGDVVTLGCHQLAWALVFFKDHLKKVLCRFLGTSITNLFYLKSQIIQIEIITTDFLKKLVWRRNAELNLQNLERTILLSKLTESIG